MRFCRFAVAQIMLPFLLRKIPPLVLACAVINVPAMAESIKSLANGFPKFCAAARAQGKQLLRRDGSFCAFPMGDTKDSIKLVAWAPVSDDQAKRAWGDYLARVYWDKGVSPDYDQLWERNRQGILATLKQGAVLEKATFDVDGDGSIDVVYRATTIRPIDMSDSLKGWAPVKCDVRQPYHSIFFARSDWGRMSGLTPGGNSVSADLFHYGTRTYLLNSGPDIFGISKVSRTSVAPTEVYAEQVCAFLLTR
jgi:hypothetical protein